MSDEERHQALLVTSELVTNAYQHGEGTIEVKVALRDRELQLEVIDEGDAGPVRIGDEDGPAGGWGLKIVDQLASEWGVLDGTTHVWAKLALA